MLKIAKRKLKISKISLSSVESLKFKSNFFDYIFSVDAFHHYSSKEKAMESFHRVLKSGGKLAVVDLTFGDFLNKIFHRIEPGNSGVCNKIQMRGIFAKYNFKEVKQSKIGMFTVMTAGVK